ncbi:uncharacterized protein LOC131301200 isoform X2 [Rhododendron vialii]|uniref:uncharacterized protein LOC131301200 isoform X2 n=1 Tax=Rhododendron vialii TaxID=182163 RepID=UPI00265EC375|nr:uncharacterized protein LOC131301200 isoform X2 [Rhododendron vialii]
MANYTNPDDYNHDLYDEENWDNDDPYGGDPYDGDPYDTGEGSSHPTPCRANARMRRAAVEICNIHHDMYMCKEPCRTSALTGQAWVTELEEGNPKRMYQSFRMSKMNFFSLVYQLEHNYGLQVSERISVAEQVAIFLWIMGQRANNRNAQERFQHSGETISRQFHNVLNALNAMAIDWVRPWPQQGVHSKIANNPRYYPHFKDCIGAIDGTHIKAHPPTDDPIQKWIGRKGYPTQNIMAACDFDMCFTFVLSGWEGNAHDTRIFYDCIRNPALNFPTPQGDAGYPNTRGYLAPYKGCRYHPPEWRDGGAPRTNFERFNKIHSSLRCTIERTYGVWKARWPLICDMPVGFIMTTQVALVSATMAIHNFIRRNNFPDIPFGFYDRRPNFLPSDRGVETTAPNGNHGNRVQRDDRNMDTVRASMRDFIVENNIR